MEKKEFLKNLEDIRGKVNKLAIDRLNEQPDEEKGIEKKIPEGCIEIPLSEVSYIYQSPFSHNPTVVMKTHEKVTSIRKKDEVLEDGQIISAVDEEGLTHIFILKEIKP